MTDDGLGRKDEATLIPTYGITIARRHDADLTLLPDCGTTGARARVAELEEVAMQRVFSVLVLVSVVGIGRADAQEAGPGPGVVEVSIIPGGGIYFTEATDAGEPAFGNYDLGGAFTVNVNRYIGIEGEVSGAIGVSQDLQLGGLSLDRTSPHLLNYSGNVVFSAANRSSVVPYVTAGVGGLTMFEEADLGIDGNETFLTGNVGGGVKWYAGRWGLRGDYRFLGVQSKDDAPAFFGRETRYGHRVYGAVIFNVVR
jgi:hypothetical protein